MPWLNLPFPSLIYLVVFWNTTLLQAPLNSFPKFSPNIRQLSFYVEHKPGNIEHSYLCRWQNLCSVITPTFPLGMDDLVDLSRISTLTHLEFAVGRTLPDPDSPLSFANLHELILRSGSLKSISRLLGHIRLPAITDFRVWITDGPSRRELASFFTSVLTSQDGHTIKKLSLIQMEPQSDHVRSEALLLGLEDLRPCMALSNLGHLRFSVECNVCLTDSDLLTLTSAWPKLQDLRINPGWGWHSQYGITPDGLVRLWQTCPSLSHIELRLDVRGYTRVPPSEASESLRDRLTIPPTVTINVLDAAIEAESVPAVATFFCGIAACCGSSFWLGCWDSWIINQISNAKEYKGRWGGVRERVYEPGSPCDSRVPHEF